MDRGVPPDVFQKRVKNMFFDIQQAWGGVPLEVVQGLAEADTPFAAAHYPDGFVSADKQWLHFAYDDARHRAVHYSAKLPALPAKWHR